MEIEEFLKLKGKIESSYKRDMEALQRVWAIANEDNEPALTSETVHEIVEQVDRSPEEQLSALAPSEGSPAVQSENGALKRWSLRKEIERLLPEFGADEDITSGKVKRTLMERFPDHTAFMHSASVSSALRRIAQSGKLVLVSTGIGSEPNRYRKPEDVGAGMEDNEDTLLKSGP